ncbi:MAG: transcription antitermination factor NusB [Gammaproteobacteria bacterium]|jgi:N utilization substance protein B
MKPAARHKARSYAIQALYEWIMSGNQTEIIKTRFLNDYDFKKTDIDYFVVLLKGVTTNHETLDQHLLPYLDRPIKELDPIELCILRMAMFELTERLDVPYKVVINEAVELAKKFGVTGGHKYVNGVLDKAAKKLRPHED